VNVSVLPAESTSFSASLCASLEVGVSPFGEVVNDEDRPYAIVHQFNRFESLEAIAAARFQLDSKKLDNVSPTAVVDIQLPGAQ